MQRDDRVPVLQHLDAPTLQSEPDLFRARPVVVVAEHADDGRLEPAHDLGELVEVELAVADEVARDQHEDEVCVEKGTDGQGDARDERRPCRDIGRCSDRLHSLQAVSDLRQCTHRELPDGFGRLLQNCKREERDDQHRG